MLEITLVRPEERETLRNLMEKYLCEFSQWELMDVDEQGLYGYEWLDDFLTQKNRWPYFLRVDGKLAGLALVNDFPEVPEEKTDFCISEFFILPRYRRRGVGKEAVFRILDMHHGKWQLKRHHHNIPSVHFWNRVISEYTGGNFRLVEGYPNPEVNYEDGTAADVFFFEN